MQAPSSPGPSPKVASQQRRSDPDAAPALKQALAKDPQGQAALDALVAQKKLDGADGAALGNQLMRLAKAPSVVTGLGSQQVLSQLAKDLADPDSIVQGAGNAFCGAARVSSELARREPAQYARMVADLALTGRTTPNNGEKELVVPQFKAERQGGISATQRLLGPALTERANGNDRWINADGVSSPYRGKRNEKVRGSFAAEVERMMELTTGKPHGSLYFPKPGDFTELDKAREIAASDANELIAAQLKGGVHPSISDGGHWYAVTDARDGQLALLDPETGRTSLVAARSLFERAEALTFQEDLLRAGDSVWRMAPTCEKPGGDGDRNQSGNPIGTRS